MRFTTAILCVVSATGLLGGCASNATNHSRVMSMLNELHPVTSNEASDGITSGSIDIDQLMERLREPRDSTTVASLLQNLTLTFGPQQQTASDNQREQIAAWLDSATSAEAGIRINVGPAGRTGADLQALLIARQRGYSVALFLYSVTERVDVHFEPKLRRDTVTIQLL